MFYNKKYEIKNENGFFIKALCIIKNPFSWLFLLLLLLFLLLLRRDKKDEEETEEVEANN